MQNSSVKFFSVLFFLISIYSCTTAQNPIYQWRGENRDGIYNETGLLKEWPAEGPSLLWENSLIGNGYSSPIITDKMILISGRIDSMEVLTALSFQGDSLWQIPFGNVWAQSYKNSRSTPTVEGDLVYISSGSGELVCISISKKEIVWKRDVMKDFDGIAGTWGIAESPLLVGDKVVFTPGGHTTTMVAFDKLSGKTVWQTKSVKDTTAYVSPILIKYNNQDMIVGVSARTIFAVNPDDGKFIWTFDYYSHETPTWHHWAPVINAITPIYHNNDLYVTSGYNHVGVKFNLLPNANHYNLAWTDTTIDCHHGGVVLVDGYLYGSTWDSNRDGKWACIDFETGKTMYCTPWETKGSIIYADGCLYCYDERRGNLALVKATPEKFDIISSFKIDKGTGPHWAHPVIGNGALYVRHGKMLMAYDINN